MMQVVLTDDMLCVSGERIEAGSGGQTLKRSFARKYCIPADIHLDSIRSHLDHNGMLVITVGSYLSAPSPRLHPQFDVFTGITTWLEGNAYQHPPGSALRPQRLDHQHRLMKQCLLALLCIVILP